MNLPDSSLNGPRRIFLAVVAALVLVLAWELSKESRTGIREHHVRSRSTLDEIFDFSPWRVALGSNYIPWNYHSEGKGYLHLVSDGDWEFAPCQRNDLGSVTPEDARTAFPEQPSERIAKFGPNWSMNYLIIPDGQIILVRHTNATQTTYAVQAIQQKDHTGYFRSRKILPVPR